MCDKMAISAYILKIVEKGPFLRFQMRAKEMFTRQQFFPQMVEKGPFLRLQMRAKEMFNSQQFLLRQICGVVFWQRRNIGKTLI